MTPALPASTGEAAALLRAAAADKAIVGLVGSGTKAGWAATPDPVDLTIGTTGSAALLAHHAGDLTVAVQAGMRLEELQRLVAPAGQWLAVDPASEAAGATVGGLLVTGDAGPRRLRYGSLRDLAIGTTVVLVDGTVVHSGSHVIKNVAGYDLTKLFFASYGTLGLVAEVILRLHPVQPASVTVAVRVTAAQAMQAGHALMSCGVQLSALEWVAQPVPVLLARLDSSANGVEAGAQRVRECLAGLGHDAEQLDAAEASRRWVPRPSDPAASSVVVSTLPSAVAGIVESAERLAGGHEVTLSISSGIALGLVTVVVAGDAAAQVAFITELRRRQLAAGAAVAVRDRPAAVDAVLDVMGPPPPEITLLQAIQHQLDPDRRCSPGRLRGWY